MEAFYFYGFWILIGVVIVLVLFIIFGKRTFSALKKKCEYFENMNIDLQEARKESSDAFSFAVRFLVTISGQEISKFKTKIFHAKLGEESLSEQKAIDKITFILDQEK